MHCIEYISPAYIISWLRFNQRPSSLDNTSRVLNSWKFFIKVICQRWKTDLEKRKKHSILKSCSSTFRLRISASGSQNSLMKDTSTGIQAFGSSSGLRFSSIWVGNLGGKSRWEIWVGNLGGKSRWEISSGLRFSSIWVGNHKCFDQMNKSNPLTQHCIKCRIFVGSSAGDVFGDHFD